jgi:hypothetical protein
MACVLVISASWRCAKPRTSPMGHCIGLDKRIGITWKCTAAGRARYEQQLSEYLWPMKRHDLVVADKLAWCQGHRCWIDFIPQDLLQR